MLYRTLPEGKKATSVRWTTHVQQAGVLTSFPLEYIRATRDIVVTDFRGS